MAFTPPEINNKNPIKAPSADDELNPGQKHYNSTFNDLNKAESAGNTTSQTEAQSNSDIDGVKQAEQESDNNWTNNFIPQSGKAGGDGEKKKSKGPIAVILSMVLFLLLGAGMLGNPANLAQTILGDTLSSVNGEQEAVLTSRTHKMWAAKMTGTATSGSCVVVTILCKFSLPSDRFLSQLEKNGIGALNKEGDLIKKKFGFNERPAKYTFIGSNGIQEIEAKDLYKTIKNDAKFRAAFTEASKTRFMSLSDKVGKAVAARFTTSNKNTTKNAKTSDEIKSQTSTASEMGDDVAKTAVKNGGVGAETVAKNKMKEEATEVTEKVIKAGKSGGGNAASLAAGVICLVTDIPGLITRAARSFQMAKLIKFASPIFAALGAVKAGDASPEQMTAIGDLLTQKDTNGESAMQSFGMNHVINGDTKSPDDSYKKYAPGSTTNATLKSIAKITSSPIKNEACKVMTNPVTGEAINAALALNAGETLGATAIAAIANIVIGWSLSTLVEKFAEPIISATMQFLPTEIILGFFFDGLTNNLEGKALGNALISGISHRIRQTSNAGGSMPLTTHQALAYEQIKSDTQLAYAEEDRATKSPLDISSPNTMMGSIVHQVSDLYASSNLTNGSIINTVSTMGKIALGSFGNILKPFAASAESDPTEQYKMCDDPDIKDNDIAAGPFCDIIYGIPPEYLNEDPMDVLIDIGGDIDDTTGEPIADSDLQKWLELCTTGKTDQANNCKITEQKQANYALYTIDHRIQQSMDEEDFDSTTTTTSATIYDNIDTDLSKSTLESSSRVFSMIDTAKTALNLIPTLFDGAFRNNTTQTKLYAEYQVDTDNVVAKPEYPNYLAISSNKNACGTI